MDAGGRAKQDARAESEEGSILDYAGGVRIHDWLRKYPTDHER